MYRSSPGVYSIKSDGIHLGRHHLPDTSNSLLRRIRKSLRHCRCVIEASSLPNLLSPSCKLSSSLPQTCRRLPSLIGRLPPSTKPGAPPHDRSSAYDPCQLYLPSNCTEPGAPPCEMATKIDRARQAPRKSEGRERWTILMLCLGETCI